MKICKNVPIPKKRTNYRDIISEMEIGDSILLDEGMKASNVLVCLKTKGMLGVSKQDPATKRIRVWRIK